MPDSSEVMVERQRVLASFGDFALQSEDLDAVLAEACRLVAEAMGTGRAKVLEIEPGGGSLLVRAGVGWAPGVVGQVRIPMAENSSESFSIQVREPVITNDIRTETRFALPPFLRDAGVMALANVPIFLLGRRAYGLLQVDDTEPRGFDEADTGFLRTYATILGPVIDRLLKVRELRSAEERFRLTVEAATDYAILVTDGEHRITDWLPGAAAVFGWSAEEIVGQPASILFTPEDREAGEDQEEVEAARREGYAPDVRWHLRRDGSLVFIEGSVRALHDASGALSGFLKVGQDVTERRATEEALRTSEALFRQFAEASSDVLWIRDAGSLRFDYVSPAFEAVYGDRFERVFAENDLRRWARLIVPEDRGSALGAFRRVREGEQVTHEFRIKRASDGEERWIRDTDFPLRGEGGHVERVAGIGQDVTELKRAEAAVAASEARLRSLAEGIPQLVWRAAGHGEWSWASPQWTAFTGQAEAASHGWGWLDALHPDDREGAREAWERSKATNEYEAEHRLLELATGAHRWFQSRATPVLDDAGRLVEWLGTSTDVQDLREMQDRLQVLVGELQHRTRNLMGVVLGVMRRTKRGGADPERFAAGFQSRLEALARVQGLLSRLDEGERVAFDELIRAELGALGALDKDGWGVQVTLDGPQGVRLRSSTIQTFALGLHELATNAAKYGALAQRGGRLAVRWRRTRLAGGPGLRVEWTESGVAMPAPGAPPQGGGYGRELIEQALPYQLGAETTFELGADGVRCIITLPLSSGTERAEA